MSRLCLSVALLILLGTLVATTSGNEKSNQVQAQRPAFCLERPYTGPCRAMFKRYFYNAKSGLCETFTYGGCRHKQNNFPNEKECISTCGGHEANGPRRKVGREEWTRVQLQLVELHPAWKQLRFLVPTGARVTPDPGGL
ncbi:spleen trypsin inhibitor I-like [Hippopotamus amphibius kiboko]|uniref:spleen trypsin inhibitor I-like n=1 Tax=Hippopotamus amphibius kiboko TaxID=575201 RepID=UPI002597C8CD|nr:spleen trypsin inhibitor I-like [Hippopotamus amphibius kiboko]